MRFFYLLIFLLSPLSILSGNYLSHLIFREPSVYDAAQARDYDRVKKYLDNGGNVNDKGTFGNTILHMAAYGGDTKIGRLLIIHKAQLEPRSHSGDTPLHCAAHTGNTEFAQLLLHHGADINSTTNGNTPLYWAALDNHLETAQLLLDQGASMDAPASTPNKSPLNIAIYQGHEKMVHLLLHYSSLQVKELTPRQIAYSLKLALQRGYAKIYGLLSNPNRYTLASREIIKQKNVTEFLRNRELGLPAQLR